MTQTGNFNYLSDWSSEAWRYIVQQYFTAYLILLCIDWLLGWFICPLFALFNCSFVLSVPSFICFLVSSLIRFFVSFVCSFFESLPGGGGGCIFPCSLEKIGVSPLFPKNKLRCSLKFTRVTFPCSQKFYCMFPWSREIFFNVPQNSQHISVFDARLFS